MTKNPQPPPAQDRQQHNALITKQVLDILGQPGDLFKVQVQLLWDDHYRVNIFQGSDAATLKVGHSYFIHVDGAGKILAATPHLSRVYQPLDTQLARPFVAHRSTGAALESV